MENDCRTNVHRKRGFIYLLIPIQTSEVTTRILEMAPTREPEVGKKDGRSVQDAGISKRKKSEKAPKVAAPKIANICKKKKKDNAAQQMDAGASTSAEQQILQSNKFVGLSNMEDDETTENGVKQRQLQQQVEQKQKLPPIYVKQAAGTRNFRSEMNDLIKAGKILANIRLCSDGFKVIVASRQQYDLVREYLDCNKAEYFTHDVASSKPYKVVLRGLYDMLVEELQSELQFLKLNVLAVHKMSRRNKEIQYRDQLYLLHLEKGSTTLQELKAIRAVFNVIVSWERYRPVHRDVTQCSNCQGFGHGGRNCRMKTRCAKCGESHLTSECMEEANVKCINCNGEHSSTDRKCPKRAEFVKIRHQATTTNQPNRRRTPPTVVAQNMSTPQPRQVAAHRLASVPNLPPLPLDPRQRAAASTPPPGFSQEPRASQVPPVEDNSSELHSNEQLLEIFKKMSAALRGCKTKHDQMEVLTTYVLQYGC